MKYFIILAAIFLTACAPKQRASVITKKQALAQMKLQERQECLDMGFKENTETYASCRLQLYLINQERMKAAAEAAKPDCPVYSCE